MKRRNLPSTAPTTRRHALGLAVTHVAAGIAAVVTLVWAGVASLAPSRAPSATIAPSVATGLMNPPTSQELQVTLTRLSLDPEPLAAAGLTGPQVSTLVNAVNQHLSTGMQAIRDADEDLADAAKEKDRLERLVQSGLGTQQDIVALVQARATLALVRSTLSGLLDAAYEVAADNLNAQQRTYMDAIRAARGGGWDLPVPYLTMSQTEAQWVTLRDALANERIAAQEGEEPDAGCHQTYLNANSVAATPLANHSSNLSAISSAWNSATSG